MSNPLILFRRPAIVSLAPKATCCRSIVSLTRAPNTPSTPLNSFQSHSYGRRDSRRTSTRRTQPTSALRVRTYHSEFHPSPEPPADNYTPEQSAILAAAIEHIPEHGFSTKSVILGARDTGYLDVSLQLFPAGGELELVLYWLASRRGLLRKRVEHGEISGAVDNDITANASTRPDQRVKSLIMERLRMNEKIIQHWQDALAIMSLPSHISPSLRELYELSSEILYLANDRTVDASWYTKRLSVAAVYASAEVHMTEDKSPDFESTMAFVEHRMKDTNTVIDTLGDMKQYAGYLATSIVAVGRSWGMKV